MSPRPHFFNLFCYNTNTLQMPSIVVYKLTHTINDISWILSMGCSLHFQKCFFKKKEFCRRTICHLGQITVLWHPCQRSTPRSLLLFWDSTCDAAAESDTGHSCYTCRHTHTHTRYHAQWLWDVQALLPFGLPSKPLLDVPKVPLMQDLCVFAPGLDVCHHDPGTGMGVHARPWRYQHFKFPDMWY